MTRTNPITASCFRAPQRISITLPQHVFEGLVERSLDEGRSLSNLSPYLLELSLQHGQRPTRSERTWGSDPL